MIGFNRRFDPNSASLKTAFDGGEIGRGKLLSIISLDPAPPPLSYAGVSVGFVRNMVIHDFDMCAVPFGLKERVMAHGSCLADPAIGATGHVDTAVAVLSYADERIATVRNSRRAALGYDQRVELIRSDGMLSTGNELESAVVKGIGAGGCIGQAGALLLGTLHARLCHRVVGFRGRPHRRRAGPRHAGGRRERPRDGRGRDPLARGRAPG